MNRWQLATMLVILAALASGCTQEPQDAETGTVEIIINETGE